jgi:hypothetical protein
MKKASWCAFLTFVVMACTSSDLSPTPALTNTEVTGPREEVIVMQVTVKVSADVARSLHRRSPPTTDSAELLRIVETFGGTLEPMHPATADPNLMSYFIVEVPDAETAQRVINRLRQSKAIEAAYLKPPDELP